MQIHILGNVCSGKTYISKKLSQKTNIPYISLDEIIFNTDHSKRENSEIDKRIKILLRQTKRISEGGLINESWAEELLKKTQKVYIVKINLLKQICRVIKRNHEFRKNKTPESIPHFIKMLKYVFKNKDIYKEYEFHLQKMSVNYKIISNLEEIIIDLK